MGICESLSFFVKKFTRKSKLHVDDYEHGTDKAIELIERAKSSHKRQITFPVMCSQCDLVELCVSKWYFPNYIIVLYETGGAALFVKKRMLRNSVSNNPNYAYPLFFSSTTDLNNYLTRLQNQEAEPFSHHRNHLILNKSIED